MPQPYAEAFPDFGDLPGSMPPGMDDVSWKNDACPSFAGYGLRLWVDYEEPERREILGKRFALVQIDADYNHISEVAVLETDDLDLVHRYVARWADPYAPPREYRMNDELGDCDNCGAVKVVLGYYTVGGKERKTCTWCEVQHIDAGRDVVQG